MSGRVFLTADLGNSALKLVAWERAGRSRARVAEHVRLRAGAETADALREWLARTGGALGAAVSTVGPAELGAAVIEALEARVAGRVLAPPDWGGRNDCLDPGGVGSDRLFAARGAWERERGPAIVADAGSALTVDALDRDEVTGEPVFRGGAIAPGPRLLATALARGGARLFEVEPDPTAVALGRDTRQALAAGVGVGFVGAARLLVERVALEAELEAAPLYLTGGALAFLAAPGTFARREVRLCELLVHEGLLAAGTREALGEPWAPEP